MRILHAATELFPLLKVGGLGDVLGALPQAQAALGAEVRVVVPGFPAFRAVAERDMGRLEGLPGGLAATLRLGRTRHAMGQPGEALAHFEDAVTLARAAGLGGLACLASTMEGEAAVDLGRMEEAERTARGSARWLGHR